MTKPKELKDMAAAAGLPELAETLVRVGYLGRAAVGGGTIGEVGRILSQSAVTPSKAAEPTDHGWSKAIAAINERIS